MKFITVFILFIATTKIAFTQVGEEDKIVIKELIKIIDTTRLRYVDSSIRWNGPFVDLTRKKIKGSHYESKAGILDTRGNSITLNKNEREQFLNEVKDDKLILWPTNLSQNAIRVPRDSFNSRIYPNQFFLFIARPIYLRGSSLAFVQTYYLQPNITGGVNLFVFKKQEDQWRPFIMTSLGAY